MPNCGRLSDLLRAWVTRLPETRTAVNDADWIDYINNEIKQVCERKGMQYQIRRKWENRCRPVSKDGVIDLEWKLFSADQPAPSWYEGTYYVVSLRIEPIRFCLQHDTKHAGMDGPHHFVSTFSEIQVPDEGLFELFGSRFEFGPIKKHPDGIPPDGWLRYHIETLTSSFGPNVFCIT